MTGRRLESYVLTRVLAGQAVALAVVTVVVTLVVLTDVARATGGGRDLGLLDLAELTGLKAPAIILVLLPFIFLFGAMGALVTLNRRSEIIAMRAAGLSAWRILAPALLAAMALGAVAVAALNPLAAALGDRYEARRAALRGGPPAGQELWLRQGDERSQIILHARGHDLRDGRVRLRDVSLFIQTTAAGGAAGATRRIEAAEAILYPGYWRLRQVTERLPAAQSIHSDQLLLPSTLDRGSATETFASPGAVSFWKLPATIRAADLAGYSSAGYRLRLQQLLATPLMFGAMTCLAAAFSLRLIRLGDLGGFIVLGVGLGFVMFFLNQMCSALGASEVLPPALAAWAPPILALLAGATRLCFTEDG